ncbi:MAG: hypothetical protein COB24_08905 [Hyphomicrobiales bacterium]|nr:MAG: hypothetical protein COB24_08905 [Hyphomicrobiales bacterium]
MSGGRKGNLLAFPPKQKTPLKGDVVEDVEVVETRVVDLVAALMPGFDEFEADKIPLLQNLWTEIAGVVHEIGFLDKTTVLAVRDIVPIYLFYRQANAQILEEKLTFKIIGGRNGDQVKVHALIGSATAWKKLINSFSGDFGLTPIGKKKLDDVADQGVLPLAQPTGRFNNNGNFD